MKARFWLALALLAARVVPASAAEFGGLGFLPGDIETSRAQGVSADGSVVVGAAFDGAFRWTAGEGIKPITGLADALDVSADGQTVVGRTDQFAPAIWSTSGVTLLAPLWQPNEMGGAMAQAISGNGRVVVGRALSAIPEISLPAYWPDPATGIKLSYNGTLAAGAAFDVSADGAVMIGLVTVETPERTYNTAFRWTAAEGIVPLSAGGGFSSSIYANAVSADGQVIVGTMTNDIGLTQAFRWTAESGPVPLNDLLGGPLGGDARSVSGDGAAIVGYGYDEAGSAAFLWTEKAGTRNLAEVLHYDYNLGASLQGWTLLVDGADLEISADGSTIIGAGKNPDGKTEAWRASLAGNWLPGDANFDGQVDLTDFGIFKANFGLGQDPNKVAYRAQGNFDGDRDVDLSDFGILKAGMGAQAGVSAVPEPPSWLLAAMALVPLCLGRRASR